MAVLLAFGAGEAAAVTLLDRSGNGNGHHWPSQDFSAPDDAYDTEIADQFAVPFTEDWQLTSVRAIGSGGTATTARVTVYEPSASSGPGAVLFSRDAAAAPPNYEIPLVATPPLHGGIYWLSIQAVGSGQADAWGWSQRVDVQGSNPLYRNPGNGYGTGCTSFSQIGSCVGSDGDMQYVLFGDSVGESDPPSNEFVVKAPKRDRRKGTAKLPVTVEDPGTLTLQGRKLKTKDVAADGGETVRLPVIPRANAKRKLKRAGELEVSGTVTFVPTGGAQASRQIHLRLKRTP